uniref:Uncharacterized protein n=1 Tax=viral metagenome TaxID=1070528 RepID=A0A6C0BCQ8_9ZZZZ
MERLNEGISLFDITESLSLRTDKILLSLISLHNEEVNTFIKEFNLYNQIQKYIFQSIPYQNGFDISGKVYLDRMVFYITIKTDFDSGFGVKPDNYEIRIFNLKMSQIKRLARDIRNEFSYVKNINIEEYKENENVNQFLIESFNKNDGNSFIKYLELGADNLDELMELAENKNNLNIIKTLVEYGASNFNDIFIKASENNHFDIANYMIICGSNINESFITACGLGYENSVNNILNYMKSSINLNSGFVEACKRNKINIVKLLLECEPITCIRNSGLVIACEYNNIDCVKYLLDVDADDEESLLKACKNNNKDIVDLLLKYEIKDLNSFCLFLCIDEGYTDIVKLLVLKNDYSIIDLNKALDKAFKNHNTDIFKILIDRGSNKIPDNFDKILNSMHETRSQEIMSIINSKFST